MPPPRRIGLLTGGGDCPGLNAVIRAVTKEAIFHGIQVVGIPDGFLGLIEGRWRELNLQDVSGILTIGGTILGSSNKANPARYPTGKAPDGALVFEDLTDRCLQTLSDARIDALVVVGGDGTLTGAARFVECGVPCIGVPKTIDNDIEGTEITFGFLTAAAIATEALDRVHTTAASHHRAMVVEVMGRNAGWLALHAGVASGSDVILLPEIPFSMDAVADVVTRRRSSGRGFTIICAAEGARPVGGKPVVRRLDPASPDPIRLGGISHLIADAVEQRTGVESRYVVLGHVQRGGPPIAADRILATGFGHHAMKLILAGRTNRMVARQDGRLTDIDITVAAGRQRLVPEDHNLLEAARSIYTSFGV